MDSVPIVKKIPVFDLGQAQGKERAVVAHQILKAFKEYGFFQRKRIIQMRQKHSIPIVPSIMIQRSTDTGRKCWNTTAILTGKIKKLGQVTLQNIAEGLGLEAEFFGKEHGQRMFINHYPICPDPSSTLGTGGHCDPNLITIFQQQVYDLQILKNEERIGVEPLPHAFVVNFGLPITVISNGKLTSVAHRAVTNTTQARTAIGTYFCLANVVEPAKPFLGPESPSLFKPFKWEIEFLPHYASKKSVYHEALEAFKINA
ncbi:hypothetical protein HAX54_019316 [Datura stramonium]|uniref:Fe2OG dioxygenase domain-containing protein n=1 Tax=Datura stramonium TaxID=4076 RepID=A0ABS8URB5_DATST|nr:hypothetical protein [Datura stramonium]